MNASSEKNLSINKSIGAHKRSVQMLYLISDVAGCAKDPVSTRWTGMLFIDTDVAIFLENITISFGMI